MTLPLLIALAVGVLTRQEHRYYARVLIASGLFLVLIMAAAAITDAIDSPSLGFIGFLLMALAYAIPIVVVATAYQRRPLYSLKPGKRWGDS